jgi:holo-[acyl-carrier protein] synthase
MRIGVDVVKISRIAHSLRTSASFATNVFARGERDSAEQMPVARAHEFLAGRLAVKEAVLKALRIGIEDLSVMKDIEVVSETDGSPSLRLTGNVARIASESGLSDWQVSISHEAGLAIAFVLLS